MIVPAAAFIGLIVGIFVAIGGHAVDLILGTNYITGDRAMGIILTCVVLSQVAWIALWAWCEYQDSKDARV